MGRLHHRVGQHHHAHLGELLDFRDRGPLLVQQVSRNGNRHHRAHFGGAILDGFFLQQAQDGERQGLGVPDRSLAAAAGADNRAGLAERGAQPLAGHLEKPEAGDAAQLDPCPVHIQRIAHAVLDGPLVACGHHVDEVDDDESADVPQAQLPGNFVGGFEVGLQGGLLDIPTFGSAGRVDVDRHHGFGRVDHDGAARGEPDLPLEGGFDLAFYLVTIEHRDRVFVATNPVLVLGHDVGDEVERVLVSIFRVDQHLVDVVAQVVADSPDDDVALLQEQGRGLLLLAGLGNGVPELQQVVQVPLQFLCAAADARSPDNHAHTVGNLQSAHGIAQLTALVALDPS